jgi:hypothetical protein
MLITVAQVPGAIRRLPRSIPGTGPTSKSERTLAAELLARITAIEHEQRIQFERIAQIQQSLDELKQLLKALKR